MQDVTSECSGANAREGASDKSDNENATRPQRACLLFLRRMQQSCGSMTHWTYEAQVPDMPSRLTATKTCANYQKYFSAFKG